MKIVCFHNGDEENGYLSNWYHSNFTIEGLTFSSVEQWMMYNKAVCFGDDAVAKQILNTDDFAAIKALGRRVSGYEEGRWKSIRQIIVYVGILAKFSQNPDLKERLIGTGDALLAECAVKDRVWGIGLSMHDPKRFDESEWRGENLLGYALMLVRQRLQICI